MGWTSHFSKAERLLDVEALNKSRLSFFQTALIKQTKHDESSLTQQIWQEITGNELYAYLYAAPIIAVNQNFPTQEEIDNSRTRILYDSNAYLAYLYKENETELMVNEPGRDAQCQSIRPSQNFIGYGSNNQHKELEAQNVVRIRSSHWRAIAEEEAKRTPSIARLQPDDTIHTINAKLTDENTANVDDAYSKSSKHYEADVAAVAGFKHHPEISAHQNWRYRSYFSSTIHQASPMGQSTRCCTIILTLTLTLTQRPPSRAR